MNNQLHDYAIQTGFVSPVMDSQQIFRKLLKAMSEPFSMMKVDQLDESPEGFNDASYAISLTLLDDATTIALSGDLKNQSLIESLRFHSQVHIAENLSKVDFYFCTQKTIPDISSLNHGSSLYPDQSTTLIIQCDSFTQGDEWVAKGPGIEHYKGFNCSAFNDLLLGELQHMNENYSAFSTGVDLIFTCQDQFFCIPRSTMLHHGES